MDLELTDKLNLISNTIIAFDLFIYIKAMDKSTDIELV